MEYITLFIDKIRAKLNRKIMLKETLRLFVWGLLGMLLIMVISLFVPLYYALNIGAALLSLFLVVGFIIGIRKRKSMNEAALFIDSFGFGEKIITAYENRDFSDRVILLQRESAIKSLKNDGVRVKVKQDISWIRVGAALILMVGIVLLYITPTPAKKKAEELHQLHIEKKEAAKEPEKLLDAIKDIDRSELSEEDKKELKKLAESLEAARESMKKAENDKKLREAKERYDYKLDDVKNDLDRLANGNPGAAKQIKEAAKIAENQKKSSAIKASNDKTDKDAKNGENDEKNQNGENGENSQNGENGENGQNGENGENSQNGENGENGENGQNGENGENGQSGKNGANGQSGQSGQNGQKGGKDENGQGGGNGSSQGGNAAEQARNHSQDYVSVDENLTGKYSDNSTSQYIKEKNGLVWEGQKVPYNSVIKDYKNIADDGITKGKYPGSMTNIIKNYFTGLSE